MPALHATPTGPEPSWPAKLQLELSARGDRTVLSGRRHEGPLLVQKPFYPEQDGTCHLYLLHPPGGIAGGDDLLCEATLKQDARALITTPAATKFYRSEGARACQRQHLRVSAGARLEWLPQENIFFDATHGRLHTHVELAQDAQLALWEIHCLGRPASGETFQRGSLGFHTRIDRCGQPIWIDRTRYVGGEAALSEHYGLGTASVHGTFLTTLDRGGDGGAVLQEVRARGGEQAGAQFTATLLDGLLVCRYLGSRAEQARAVFQAAWHCVRGLAWGAPPVVPRIWLT